MKLNIKHIIALLRPHQYIKNLFVFMPLFFAGQITDAGLLLNAVIAFVAFSFSASAIYILNDYHDIEADRQHPLKKGRPLVTGVVSKKMAGSLMVLLAVMGLSLMASLSLPALAILSAYIVLNISYSYLLKHIAILDVTLIAIGFVLQLFVGAITTEIKLSMWIVIMTFLLALFIALAKRRDDILLFLNTGTKMRKAIDGYNLQFIDGAMSIMASVIIVAYLLYTTSIDVVQQLQNEYLYLTSIFVILGIMRYLQITFVENNSGAPTKIILTDLFIQLTVLAWVLSFVWIIYL